MGASVLKVSAGVVALMIAAGRGPAGPKGDPGGNAMAIGLATQLGGISVPIGTDLVRTTGYTQPGLGGGFYCVTTNTGVTPWRFQTANGRWFELAEDRINQFHLGAVGDGATDDTAALNAVLPAVFALNRPAYLLPAKVHHRCAGQVIWDFSLGPTSTPEILGAGPNAVQIRFDAGVASPNMYWYRSGQSDGSNGALPTFYQRIGGFAVAGNCPGGIVLQISQEDFTGAWNGLEWGSMVINNDAAADGSTGVECSGLYASRHFGIVTVNGGGQSTFGTTDHGVSTAVRIRRTEFSNFDFACGNAYIGIHLSTDYVFANVFAAQDMEVLNEFVRSDSNAACNTFLGGTIANVETPFNCTNENSNLHVHVNIMGGNGGLFKNPNATLGDPSWGGRGVHLHNPETIFIPTPSVPGANTWVQNRTGQPMQVYLAVPAGTSVFKRLWYDYSSPGLTVAVGQANTYCKLNPGDQLSWQGLYAPSWAMVPEY